MNRPAARMPRVILAALIGTALAFFPTPPASAAEAVAADTVLFEESFDTSPPGALPLGWEIVWNGAGDAEQGVSDALAYSEPSSLRLLGQPGWSAVVQHSVASDSPLLGLEYRILIDSVAAQGEEHPALFKYQAEGNIWGTYYGAVRFDHASRLILAEDGSILSRWMPQTWYSVRVLLDRKARTYDVWIDGAQAGDDLAMSAQAPDLIDAVALVAGHAGVPVYYDDVKVFAPDTDSDGDGIPDAADPCPFVNPGLIDLNVDGCVDTSLVIAAYLKEGVAPLAAELPDAAVGCWEGAVVDLSANALAPSLDDMLCVVVTLDAAGTPAAAEAAYITGLAAQTTALLAIDLQAQIVGQDDPNVVVATTLVEIGIGLLEQLRMPEAVKQFIDAVSKLFEPARPAILVEVARRSSDEFIWEKYTKTYAAVDEQVIYPIRVTNVGNVDLTNVRVWQTFSDYKKFIGGLAVGESRIVNVGVVGRDMVDFRVPYDAPDPFSMVTTGVGQYEGRWVKDSAVAEVDVIHPSIAVTITAPRAARPGQLISVYVTVTNTGDVPLHEVWYIADEGIRTFDDIGEMAPGENRFYPYHYLVPATTQQFIRFSATALGGRDYDWIDWHLLGKKIWDFDVTRVRILR